MYDRPANAAAHDQLWGLIRDNLRDAGVDAPDALDRETGYMTSWGRDDLVLGQICNLPLRAKFRPMVTMIGAADYGLPDCPAGHYNSVFIVHRDTDGDNPMDFIRGRFASNGLNLTKLESYMVGGSFTAAQFYADVEGHIDDPAMQNALEELGFFSESVTHFGTYPADAIRASGPT